MSSAAAGGNRRRPTSVARAGSFRRMPCARTIARTAAATRSGSRAISASVVVSAANVYWPASGGPSPRLTSTMTLPTPRRTAVSLPSAFAQKPSTIPRSSASAALMPKEAPGSMPPGTGAILTPSRTGSTPTSWRSWSKARSGPGAAPIRSPLTAETSPRRAGISARRTRSQGVPWESATTSFAPFQPGNASKVVCAPPATKSTTPSRSAFTASSEGKSSTCASRPSSRYRPSSSAASAGKYEFVTRSGVAIRMGLFLGDDVVAEDADTADLDLDDVARHHVAGGALGAHPEHVAGMERRGLAHLVEPRARVPDLVDRREVLPHVAVVTDDDAELGRIEAGDDPGTKRLERVAVLGAEQ